MAKLEYNAKVYEGITAELAVDTTVYAKNDLIFDTEAGVLKKGNGEDIYADLAVFGAGTGNSSLVIGTTATTAKAGNYSPSTAEVGNALKAKTQVAALVSPSTNYADLTAATSAIKSIIDALKA